MVRAFRSKDHKIIIWPTGDLVPRKLWVRELLNLICRSVADGDVFASLLSEMLHDFQIDLRGADEEDSFFFKRVKVFKPCHMDRMFNVWHSAIL